MNPTITDQFHQFIRLSESLLSESEPTTLLPEFQKFVHNSFPLILSPIRTSLETIGPRFAVIRHWLVPHDLLRIAGFTSAEDSYTELMAWALHPDTHPESAIPRQLAWLRVFPFGKALNLNRPAIPRTQFRTKDGIPDLILEYETLVVVTESKTGSDEHYTPSGTFQTLAYPVSVRDALRLDDRKPIYVVFITPERRKAANPEAFNTTFIDFCLSLASELEAFVLPDHLRWTYAALFTHFLTCAVPPGIDTRMIVGKAQKWLGNLQDDTFILENLNEITEALNLFLPGESR